MTKPQPADASARIRQAAFRLFGHKGYSRTSIQDIADAAGVKKSILYYYFRNKEELYLALLGESAEILRTFLLPALAQARQGLSEPSDGPPSCETLLGVMAETLLSLARDNRESVRFFFAHIFAADADRPVPVDGTEAMGQLMSGQIAEIAREGLARGELRGDPADLERLVLGAVQFSLIRYLHIPEQEQLPVGLGQRIASAVMRGFLAPVSAPPPAAGRPRVRTSNRNARNGK